MSTTQRMAIAFPIMLALSSCGSNAVGSVDGVKRATVRIEAAGTFFQIEGVAPDARWGGSGFIVDPRGLAVTNNHVVTGAAFLKVFVAGESQPRNAQVLGVSECSDLAVIDIDGEGFPFVLWHDGDVRQGMEVFAAGFPGGQGGDTEYTLYKGIVSKASANGESSYSSVDNAIEHDAQISGGNSGGPLIDAQGRVVGVNYLGRLIEGGTKWQHFAIGREEVLPLIEQLIHGDVTSIGINGQAFAYKIESSSEESPSEEAPEFGIWVSSVKPGSPADHAGISPADIIVRIENISMGQGESMSDYCDVLRSHPSGSVLNVLVRRHLTGEWLSGQINGTPLMVVGP